MIFFLNSDSSNPSSAINKSYDIVILFQNIIKIYHPFLSNTKKMKEKDIEKQKLLRILNKLSLINQTS